MSTSEPQLRDDRLKDVQVEGRDNAENEKPIDQIETNEKHDDDENDDHNEEDDEENDEIVNDDEKSESDVNPENEEDTVDEEKVSFDYCSPHPQ
jgi:hypothetical protein